jgi:hypothetical protein
MLFQACEAVSKKTFAPERDDFTAGVQTRGNFFVGQALGCIKDHPGSLNLKIRQRIFPARQRNSASSVEERAMANGLNLGIREHLINKMPPRCEQD